MDLSWLNVPIPREWFDVDDVPAPIFDAVRADEGPATTALRVVEVAA